MILKCYFASVNIDDIRHKSSHLVKIEIQICDVSQTLLPTETANCSVWCVCRRWDCEYSINLAFLDFGAAIDCECVQKQTVITWIYDGGNLYLVTEGKEYQSEIFCWYLKFWHGIRLICLIWRWLRETEVLLLIKTNCNTY